MKPTRFVLLLLLLHATVFAQPKPATSARAKGAARLLQDFGENGERKPEAGLIVTLKQNGASKQTNDLGQCSLALPKGYIAGEIVVLVVEKNGWRIRYPLDGEARIPSDLKKETVEVELLPVGSKLFWTDDRIEKFVRDLAEKSTQQAPAKDANEKVDFGRFIKEWAVQYGFSIEQAEEEISRWRAEIVAKSDDYKKLGLAAFVEKNFLEAAKNFTAAFAQDSTQLAATKKQKQALEEKEKQLTAQAIENARFAGASFYNNDQFENALAKYHSAQQLVDKTKDPQQWANLAFVMGNANRELGVRAPSEKIQAYLGTAQHAYQQAGEFWPREREPEGWAAVQLGLGNVLNDLGTRTGGEAGAKILAQAVTAHENALMIYTRELFPQQWATTQNSLGNVLSDLGTRVGGEEGGKLLKASVTAYEKALLVRTREQLSRDWAMTQNNLGNVLTRQGTRTSSDTGAELLSQAVAAYRQTLVVYTRDHLPQDWAMTQNNLGAALHEQGIRTSGEAGVKLLSQAVSAHRSALLVRTHEHLPQPWAMTQNNLGAALYALGTRTSGEAGAELLSQAVSAFRAALLVYTHDQLPQNWATTQTNLGAALRALGAFTSGEAGTELLAQGVEAFHAALLVFSREHLSQDWAMTQNNLGNAYQNLGTRTGGVEGAKLLRDAVTAYENALVVRTREQLPQDWAMTQHNLARAYFLLEDWPNVVACLANMLKVYPRRTQAYQLASSLSHETLFNFPEAFELNQNWLAQFPNDLSAQSDFAEKHFTTGRFAACEQRLAVLLTNSEVSASTKIALRAISIANALAQNKTQQVPAALETLQQNLAAQPDSFKVNWSFEGTKHFIRTNETLAPHRAWLLQFFAAIERTEGREAILSGLQEARKNLNAAK